MSECFFSTTVPKVKNELKRMNCQIDFYFLHSMCCIVTAVYFLFIHIDTQSKKFKKKKYIQGLELTE